MNTIKKVDSNWIEPLKSWYQKNARPLPWRQTHDPYKIWVSEIFLQQTQASRVVAFYERMLEKFPTVFDLAKAEWEDFFPYFKGLGFYSRGKNMLKTAKTVVENHDGVFPNDSDTLQTLPGIGFYTAHAICSFAYGRSVPALDTNLYRVLGRVWDKEGDEQQITKRAFSAFEEGDGDILNHALMDLGSSFCTAKKVECEKCPLSSLLTGGTEGGICEFHLQGKEVIVPKKKAVSRKKAEEFSVLVLRDSGKYLLQKKLDKSWGFPVFLRDTKEHKDHRHFLKNIVEKKWRIEISVRPPFWIEETSGTEFSQELARLRFSRCQIQSGEFFENQEYKFFTVPEIKKLKLEEVYSEEFLDQFWRMKA